MSIINLESAVNEILLGLPFGKTGKEGPAPFFIVSGGGVSEPSVPGSAEIIRECASRAGTAPDTARNLSAWLDTAFPHPRALRNYLRFLSRRNQPSEASVRLAELLDDGRIAHIAVTPNFDDTLARALAAKGILPAVCDNPVSLSRVDPADRLEIQILHTNGSYWAYSAKASENTLYSSMAVNALSTLMFHSSPIVIGYSGNEDDIIMKALRKRLESRLPYNMYWFCHTGADAETLPAWLKDHPDCRMVMASIYPSSNTLNAADVLGRMLERLKNGTAPRIISQVQPAEKPAVPRPEQLLTTPPQGVDYWILRSAEVREEIAAGRYKESIRKASGIELDNLPENELSTLMESVWSASEKLRDNSSEELLAYDIFIAITDILKAKGSARDLRNQTAKALVNKSVLLSAQGKTEEEARIYDEIIFRFGEDQEPELRSAAAKAMLNKARALEKLARAKEAVAVYNELIQKFSREDNPLFKEHIQNAFFKKGYALREMLRK